MAQQPQITTRKETKVLFSDLDGKPILEIGNDTYTIRDSNGGLIHRNLSESMQLCDGFLFNPTMLMGAKPIYIAICTKCRKKKHGIVTVHLSKTCVRCGQPNLCSKHRKLIDNQWYCIPCSRKYKLSKFFKFIFFERKG